MKNITYIIAIVILLFGCKTNTELSDAFGNFEAVTVLVSAESPGKILEFHVSGVDKGVKN